MRIKKRILVCFTMLSLAWLLVLTLQNGGVQHPIISVIVTMNGESEIIDCWEGEAGYYVFLPSYAELPQAQLCLNTENQVYIGDVLLQDGMFCEGFQLAFPYDLSYSAWGRMYQHTITFVQSGGTATMYIDTESGTMDYIHEEKGNKESGALRLYTKEGKLGCAEKVSSINGRGNATWTDAEKKAYSLELFEEEDLLGMGKAQKWILLANALDPSNLRNKIVYDFAQDVGMAYSPDSEWVDLYLNGKYAGLYLLSERNEVHPQRVDIAHSDSFLVSMEPENRLVGEEHPYITTEAKQTLRIRYPLEVTDEKIAVLTEKWQSVENAFLAENGVDPTTGMSWQEQIDQDSWARKYLIEELFGNVDAGAVSQYYYYDGSSNNGKIFAGPVWDFDLSMGGEHFWQLCNPYSFFANRPAMKAGVASPWIFSLFKEDAFYNKVIELYQIEFLPLMGELLNDKILDYAMEISRASAMNQIRWSIDEDVFYHAKKISDYMNKRIEFLHSIWIDGATYYQVILDQGLGKNYAYYAVLPGARVTDLPTLEDTEYAVFLGWFYSETDEPFDITQPIIEDIEIYAKWEDSTSKQLGQVGKLMPLGIIAVMGVIMLVMDVRKHWRR